MSRSRSESGAKFSTLPADFIQAGKLPDSVVLQTRCASCGAPVDLARDTCQYCLTPHPVAHSRRQKIEQLEKRIEALSAQAIQSEQNSLLSRLLGQVNLGQ